MFVAWMLWSCSSPPWLPLQMIPARVTNPTVTWQGPDARYVTVYDCDDPSCYKEDLPQYTDVPRPDWPVVWRASAGETSGRGALPSPVVLGQRTTAADFQTEPVHLEPGRAYRVRVVVFESGGWRTGWFGWRVPEPEEDTGVSER